MVEYNEHQWFWAQYSECRIMALHHSHILLPQLVRNISAVPMETPYLVGVLFLIGYSVVLVATLWMGYHLSIFVDKSNSYFWQICEDTSCASHPKTSCCKLYVIPAINCFHQLNENNPAEEILMTTDDRSLTDSLCLSRAWPLVWNQLITALVAFYRFLMFQLFRIHHVDILIFVSNQWQFAFPEKAFLSSSYCSKNQLVS